ncbi:MAG: class I SAM-dependent methyltransferase [bacterium]
MWKILAKGALILHNMAYRASSILAIKAEGGLHPKHRLINYHQFFLDNIEKGSVVLDIGCSSGNLAFDLAKKASRVVGIDLNKNYLNKAKKNKQAQNIDYILGDATTYEFKEKFDFIVLSNVLEHIEKRKEFLEKIKSLANKFLIRVPILDRDWITLYKKEMGVEYRLDRGHFVEYTKDSFEKEMRDAGLKIEKFSINFGEILCVILV